ncbi:MAG TPA: hypothetical protein VMN39_06115 [Longimicrobiaceae bacterium]|nr:hypothetical protein [Longimicrobiaceae bacterium]
MATRRQFLGAILLGGLAASMVPADTRASFPSDRARADRDSAHGASELKRYITLAAAAQAAPALDA